MMTSLGRNPGRIGNSVGESMEPLLEEEDEDSDKAPDLFSILSFGILFQPF